MISLAELRFLIDDEQNFQLISILSKILPFNIKQQTIIKKKGKQPRILHQPRDLLEKHLSATMWRPRDRSKRRQRSSFKPSRFSNGEETRVSPTMGRAVTQDQPRRAIDDDCDKALWSFAGVINIPFFFHSHPCKII